MADRPRILLAGQAYDLTISGGIARWQIVTRNGTINLCGDGPIADQCRMMNKGQPIGVIARLPSPSSATTDAGTLFTYEWRLDSPDVELTVIRLELLHDPRLIAFWMQNFLRILNSAWDAWEVAAELDRLKAA